jgi:ATP-dependent Clp protease protease subunit
LPEPFRLPASLPFYLEIVTIKSSIDKESLTLLQGALQEMKFAEPQTAETESKKPEEPLNERFLKTRTVLLVGEIDKDLSEKVVRQLLLLESISEEPITLLIDSPGGDVYAGFSIFDVIRFIKAPVRIVGIGLVASAAALILIAVPKDRRFGLPNSSYLIHQPLSGMNGVATDIEIHAKELERTRLHINELLAEATGQALEKIIKDTDRDFWMNAQEAMQYGLIGKVIMSRQELG